MRKKVDLTGEWLFRIDPFDEGLESGWFKETLTTKMNVKVPHIWQREGGEFIAYTGAAWYQKEINDLDLAQNKEWHICFEAVDYQCDIFWNDTYLGFHEGGFTPFHFKIERKLIQKNNRLTVRVYDFPDNAEIPIGKQGSWYTRVSGIWQSVFLEERPRTFVSNVFVTPDIDSEQVEVTVEVSGNRPIEEVYYELRTHSIGEEEWNDDSAGYAGFFQTNAMNEIIAMPTMKLWSPEQPYLYEIQITVKADGQTDKFTSVFGCRKVEFVEGKIHLNHKPVYIRGALDQAFYPETIYTAPSVNYIKREISLAKQMGFNLLRKHIKVEVPEYLYWADRLGMLIWAEPPNYVKWTKLATERFTKGLREMVERDYNHPSIIIWSVYNEEWGLEWDLEFDQAKQEHVSALFSKVKEWDRTRLICDNSGWTHLKTDINDHHRYFVAPDQLNAWKQDLDEYVIGKPDKNFVKGYRAGEEPIIVSEFGVWGLPEVSKLKEFYNGNEPWWFVNQGEETHQDDYKKPVTLFENFNSYGISDCFKDPDYLAKRSQKRMVRAVKSLIEEMRKRPAIAGYVITEFTDIEWEANGWLDYLREPKEDFDKLIHFNGANCIMADLPKRNYQSGEKTAWDIFIVLDVPSSSEVTLKWNIESNDKILEKGERNVHLDGQTFVHLKDAIELVAPNVQGAVSALLNIEFWTEEGQIAANYEELTITGQKAFVQNLPYNVFIQHPSNELRHSLSACGAIIKETAMDAEVILTNHLDRDTIGYVRDGGKVIFLAEEGDHIEEKGEYSFRQLDLGESWARASSMNYVNTSWLQELPIHPEMGWEFEGLFPDYVMPFKDYKKVGKKRTVHMFGNPSLAESAEVISGYFQGWLGQNGGSVLLQRNGEGVILTVTWKLASQIKQNPIALLILNHFIAKLASGSY